LKLSGAVTLDQIVRAPGVFQTDEELSRPKHLAIVEKALQQALTALVKMREREGAHLAQDLAARVGILQKCAGQIQKHRRKRRSVTAAAHRAHQKRGAGITRTGRRTVVEGNRPVC